MERRHFTHFVVAGFTYYDGPLVFNKLKVGVNLRMQIEEANKFDAYAIALYFQEHKIGFVPRTENKVIYKLLEQGHEIFEARIQRVSPQENTENQLQCIVYLLPSKASAG